MDLSVLDVLPVGSGMTPRQALCGAVSLARVVDRSGYRRLWFAEHHGMANIASTSPELLIAHVAPATQRIRLGAGGVMLLNHTPFASSSSTARSKRCIPVASISASGAQPG